MDTGIHLVNKDGSRARFSTFNPATGAPIAEYAAASAEHVSKVVASARLSQLWWSQVPVMRRAAVLRRVAKRLSAEKESLARVITAESGKPLQEALLNDVLVAADAAIFCADNAAKIFRTEEIPHSNPALRFKRGRLSWEPLGVIGIISPWNYPLSIPAADTFAALATGNAVVLKPSELTPQAGIELERIISAALHEEGLSTQPRPFQVITGLGPTGQALVDSAIDKLIFTGSVPTGRLVAAAAGKRLLPVTLELGGKDAMIVLADADLDVASSAAVWGSMMNAGQTCLSVERCYVHRSIYSKFLALCLDKISKLKIGDGALPDTDVGPMISFNQLQIVEHQVDEARALGATVHAGGSRLPDLGNNFYAPTLITDVDSSMSLMCQETFGPVLPVVPFSSDEEAISLANDSEFGLAASVWGSRAHATAVGRRIAAGTVMINDLISGFAISGAPHGGLKLSGIGRTHGLLGMQELVSPRYLDIDLLPRMKKLWWYPYSGKFAPMSAFAGMVHASGIRQRLTAAMRSIPLLLRPRS
ncbi:MAG TPA: aldehyde dehydrogenase family protein [Candidatus Saccharimonadales bacterium]|nr:aldehyde dehydrogenase family protein [Candidatus Saccharimonadales bacterium]